MENIDQSSFVSGSESRNRKKLQLLSTEPVWSSWGRESSAMLPVCQRKTFASLLIRHGKWSADYCGIKQAFSSHLRFSKECEWDLQIARLFGVLFAKTTQFITLSVIYTAPLKYHSRHLQAVVMSNWGRNIYYICLCIVCDTKMAKWQCVAVAGRPLLNIFIITVFQWRDYLASFYYFASRGCSETLTTI